MAVSMYAGRMRVVGFVAMLAGVLQADTRCLPCHSETVASYSKTGMGRSVTLPSRETVPEQWFKHPFSGAQFGVSWRAGRLVHEMSRDGRRVSYPAAWAIGSGNQGKSYLIALGDALFQSPVSWYSARRTWDVSPGFEQDRHPDFFRPVTSDCLFCHAGTTLPRDGTMNRYLDPPFRRASIGCDRCHGEPESHLAGPKRANIVNPARLDPDRRDAVCEQCHLSGEARIPNPGRKFSDFRPGMRLEEVFSVYVKQAAGDPMGLKVVSHSEQMARSRCFLESGGKMWCASCHDPHRKPAEKAAWFREKCLGCHQSREMPLHKEKVGGDCAACHMPRVRSYDGGHTAFTDHWIRLKREEPPSESGDGLRAWREPEAPLRDRNLGLAYISAGSRTGASSQLIEGFKLLGSTPADGAVETARGLVLLQADRAVEALKAFRRAMEERPRDSTRRLNLAAALLAAGDRAEAGKNAEKAIELEPLLEDAYALLAEIEPKRAAYWKDRYDALVRKAGQVLEMREPARP